MPPKTNELVVSAMRVGAKIVDNAIANVQSIFGKSISPLMNMMADTNNDELKNTPIVKYLPELTDAAKLGSAAIALLNQVRKDNIRNELGFPASQLCTWATPVGDGH